MPSSNITITATFPANFTHKLVVGWGESWARVENYGFGSYQFDNKGSISPNSLNGYTIKELHSQLMHDENGIRCYINMSFDVSGINSPFNKVRVTRLDTNVSKDLSDKVSKGFQHLDYRIQSGESLDDMRSKMFIGEKIRAKPYT